MFSVCAEFGLDEDRKTLLEERILLDLSQNQLKTYRNVEQIYIMSCLRDETFLKLLPLEVCYYDLMEISHNSIKSFSEEGLLYNFCFNPEYYFDFNLVLSELNPRIFGLYELPRNEEKELIKLFGKYYPSIVLLRKFYNLENLEIKTFYDLMIEGKQ